LIGKNRNNFPKKPVSILKGIIHVNPLSDGFKVSPKRRHYLGIVFSNNGHGKKPENRKKKKHGQGKRKYFGGRTDIHGD
jgi:hypothetical protein